MTLQGIHKSLSVVALGLNCLLAHQALAQAPTPKSNSTLPNRSSLVGARVGLTNVESIRGSTLGMGAYYDYAVAENLLVGASIDYWKQDVNLDADHRGDVSDIILGGNAKLIFTRFRAPFLPFALLGVSGHRIVTKESVSGRGGERTIIGGGEVMQVRHTEADLGVDLGTGMLYRVSQAIDMNAELRWRNVFQSSMGLNQLSLTAGLAYLL